MLIIKSRIRWIERDFHEELAHVMIEAEKAHNLLSTSWRPSHWCSFSPENQGVNGVGLDSILQSQEPGALMYIERKDGYPAPAEIRLVPTLLFLFYWCLPKYGMMTSHIDRVIFFMHSTNPNANIFSEIFFQTQP